MAPNDDDKNIIACITIKLAQLGHDVMWQDPITKGPMVTTYRFAPRQSTKVSTITGLTQDLALALKVEDVIIRRLPGEGVIGVTVPNRDRHTVSWRDTLTKPPDEVILPINFGMDYQGELFRDDLTKMPHLLIAGATDSGKSTLLNCIIASLMYWRSPDQLQMVLSDTKLVEFGHFIGSPHLLYDPVTTKYQTWEKMDWLIEETDRRLAAFAKSGCKNMLEHVAMWGGKQAPKQAYPYIVVVIDELFDILGGDSRGESKLANKKLQQIVGRSRAAGIHIIAATQRSSTDVVSGTVKANFPARVSFRLPSEVDSRTILGHSGAEHLLSRGDMWYVSPSRAAMLRLHSAMANADDIKQCVSMVTMMNQMK